MQSIASQYAVQRPYSLPCRPSQTTSSEGGLPSGVPSAREPRARTSTEKNEKANAINVLRFMVVGSLSFEGEVFFFDRAEVRARHAADVPGPVGRAAVAGAAVVGIAHVAAQAALAVVDVAVAGHRRTRVVAGRRHAAGRLHEVLAHAAAAGVGGMLVGIGAVHRL